MVSDKKLITYIKMLQATKYGAYGPEPDWKKRKKGAYKLGELGDARAIEHLLKHATLKNVLILDAIVKIGLSSNENLIIARDALQNLQHSGPALKAKIGHYRTTIKGNLLPPDESIWLNYIISALKNLAQGKNMFTKDTTKYLIEKK